MYDVRVFIMSRDLPMKVQGCRVYRVNKTGERGAHHSGGRVKWVVKGDPLRRHLQVPTKIAVRS